MMGLRIAGVCPIGSRISGGAGSPEPFLPASAKSPGSRGASMIWCASPTRLPDGRPVIRSCFLSCNCSCSLKTSCDAQIAYLEWEAKTLPQASVQACHPLLRAFPVTGGCEARRNA